MLKMITAILMFFSVSLNAATFEDSQLPAEVNLLVNSYLVSHCNTYIDIPVELKAAKLVKYELSKIEQAGADGNLYTLDLTLTFDPGNGAFDVYQMIQLDDLQGHFHITNTFGGCRTYVPYN